MTVEEEKIYGYTLKDIRMLDELFKKSGLSFEILNERYLDGFRNGQKYTMEMLNCVLGDLKREVEGK